LVLFLRKGVAATSKADSLEFCGPTSRVTFKRVSPVVRRAIEQLVQGEAREDQIADAVVEADGANELPRVYYYLERLTQLGFLLRSARLGGERLATLTPTSRWFTFGGRAITPEKSYVLSRFAYARRHNDELILESPLAHSELALHDWRAAALIQLLSQPRSVADVVDSLPALTAEAAADLLTLMVGAGMVHECDGSKSQEEAEPALQMWEFHDLVFHARSRVGRHDNPIGGTYRFAGQLDSPPALKPTMGSDSIALFRPNLEELSRSDAPYIQVQEGRRSIREFGDPPISAREIGEFLFRVGRVKDLTERDIETPNGSVRMDFAFRPYPGGGALYELELYLVVNRCANLAAGLYHYEPLNHRLERLSGQTPDSDLLLQAATSATSIPTDQIQVLIVVAARFQRMAWKYNTLAYAATLKHVGVLYQTMYLSATAMGLAPCAIGCGDADQFARAAGTDYLVESSVGEFLIGSRKTDS
jgi:SagB-type dehydrogenase family enzyme